MCGITGIYYNNINNGCQIYQSLLSIQHRGQDGAGIYWCNNTENDIIKKNGLISNTFNHEILKNMRGTIYIAHNRYKTNNVFESFQPFFLSNDKIKMSLCHNGNIINTDELLYIIKNIYKKNIDLISDSYVLTVYIFEFLNVISKDSNLTFDHIIELSYNLQKKINGSFSILLCIQNFGLIAIRDKNGIRPLSYGINNNGDYLISSETCSFNHTDFTYIDEIENGETILFNGEKHHYKYCNHIRKEYYLEPCLFEYIYFSRVDSIFNKISVYKFRYLLGQLLGKYCSSLNIDYIVPGNDDAHRAIRFYCQSAANLIIETRGSMHAGRRRSAREKAAGGQVQQQHPPSASCSHPGCSAAADGCHQPLQPRKSRYSSRSPALSSSHARLRCAPASSRPSSHGLLEAALGPSRPGGPSKCL